MDKIKRILGRKDDRPRDTIVTGPVIKPQHRPRYDPTVSFEEYYYYAQLTRSEEDAQTRTDYESSFWSLVFPSKSANGVPLVNTNSSSGSRNSSNGQAEKAPITQSSSRTSSNRSTVSDDEWTNASRALRTATRGAIFYLITTDILGPFGLPYAFATMGWGPGIALFTVFAGLAGYSGYLIWTIFLGLDSYQYPVRTFGDLGYRIYGPYMRHLFNVLQCVQLMLNVGLIVISNGEALSQAVRFRLCFCICCLVWALVGFAVGQIRTLQKFGWLANAAVWINIVCMLVTMAAAAHSPPNYAGAGQSAGASIAGGIYVTPDPDTGAYPSVRTTAGLPDTGSFIASVSGAMQAIFAYGGAMVFPEFMAEMRRPKDFLTAMWAAQGFIYFWYMFYGLFMYGYQGQYAINPSFLGISLYSLQTVGNVLAMCSAIIAAALYGNIGTKVIYNNILVEFLHAPPLTTRAGKISWAGMIPLYWAIAFTLAAGIPNFSGLMSVVAAFCILHFAYTFPPMLAVGFMARKNAFCGSEGFNPATGQLRLVDYGFRRWIRGFMAYRWWLNVANVVYFFGALVLSGLGAYSAIMTLRKVFADNTTTSYVCKSPLDG